MDFSCISPDEARRMYRDAVDPKKTIKILAELTVSTQDQVRSFLGLEIVEPKRRRVTAKRGSVDHRLAVKLHRKGLSDQELANSLEVSKTAIVRWRQRNMLPSNAVERKPSFDRVRAKELYDEGLIDAAIGAALGVGGSAVWRWRKNNDLPANGIRGGWQRRKKNGTCGD